jgi:hypothetical protein
MTSARCPMCQCENFHWERLSSGDGKIVINLGFFSLRRSVTVGCRVCLTCGFVAPYLDQDGLASIRKKARRQGVVIDDELAMKERPEL